MKLNFHEYKDKVRACWIGKNIGGTMGAPYEGKREVLDVKGFATPPGEALPNDDLDLQLVWLHAMETVGPYDLDCVRLGEFWLSYIPPHWHEYGVCKSNMQLGLLPPLSGDYRNSWKHSNGAWIRTEIWASLAPACPAVAARYAIEDACVDHGTGEGTVAAAFVAVLQSSAFAEGDIRRCIDLALAHIPEESRTAQSVRKVLESYDGGASWLDARNAVLEMNMDIGNGWFEAPSNVAYAVLGLVYGEGDFKRSMLTAINCGDDTDCTAATVGATLGILGGTAAIPQDWSEYIGDRIVTMAIATGTLRNIPETCTQLTDRVTALAPLVLQACETGVALTDGENEIPSPAVTCPAPRRNTVLKRLCAMKPYSFETDMTMYKARVTWDRSPDIAPGDTIGLTVEFIGKRCSHTMTGQTYGNSPYFLSLRWHLPEGFSVEGPQNITLPHITPHENGTCKMKVSIRAGERVEVLNRITLEVTAMGRCVPGYVPLVLIG